MRGIVGAGKCAVDDALSGRGHVVPIFLNITPQKDVSRLSRPVPQVPSAFRRLPEVPRVSRAGEKNGCCFLLRSGPPPQRGAFPVRFPIIPVRFRELSAVAVYCSGFSPRAEVPCA